MNPSSRNRDQLQVVERVFCFFFQSEHERLFKRNEEIFEIFT